MPQSPWPPAFGMQRYSPWGHPPGDGYISHQTGSLENHLQICNFFGGYVSLLVPWRVPLWISIVGRWNFLLGKALGYVSFQGGCSHCSHWIVYIWIVFQLVRTIAVGLQVSNVLFQGSFFSLRLHGCNYSGWIWSDLIVTTKKNNKEGSFPSLKCSPKIKPECNLLKLVEFLLFHSVSPNKQNTSCQRRGHRFTSFDNNITIPVQRHGALVGKSTSLFWSQNEKYQVMFYFFAPTKIIDFSCCCFFFWFLEVGSCSSWNQGLLTPTLLQSAAVLPPLCFVNGLLVKDACFFVTFNGVVVQIDVPWFCYKLQEESPPYLR